MVQNTRCVHKHLFVSGDSGSGCRPGQGCMNDRQLLMQRVSPLHASDVFAREKQGPIQLGMSMYLPKPANTDRMQQQGRFLRRVQVLATEQLSSQEVDSGVWDQILSKAVCISHNTNIPRKDIRSAMAK